VDYERLKAECFEAECEQKKARQLLMTIKHDFNEIKKLLENTVNFNKYQAQLVKSFNYVIYLTLLIYYRL